MITSRFQTSAAALLGFAVVLAPAVASATTCSTVSACVFGTNAGKGYGVEGSARSNYGVFGTSSANSGVYGSTTVNATSAGSGKSGVSGYDSSTNKKTFNSGVFGFSAYGNGVHAKSTSGNGLYGESSSGTGVSGSTTYGVGVSGYGPVGIEASTPGDESEGDSYIALQADSFAVEGTGVVASGGEYGIAASIDDTENINPGAAIYATGYQAAPAILADTQVLDTGSDEGDSLDILTSDFGSGLGVFGGSGTPLTLFATGKALMTAANAKKDVMSLDSSGNMILDGTLTQKGSAKIVSQRADGTAVLTYGSRSADPTIEDVGEASVTGGVATVALDPSFAGTINFAHPYFVFLTPEGDNAGLYVAAKTPRGFVVHEARGAHSTLRVQYRIVASPLDDRATTARLQRVTASVSDSAQMVKKFQQLRQRDALQRQRFARLKRDHAARVARG